MDTVFQDIRIGWRLLARQPGFAVIAVLTLALGIGANAAVFTVVNSVLLRPLPYPDSDGLLRVSEQRPFGRGPMMSILTNETYHAWLERTRTIESLAAYTPRSYTLTGDGDARSLAGASVSAALFPMLRAAPALGRLFTEADEKPGANRLVILSHRAWGELLGSDPRAVGRAITLDGQAHQIIGVMPASFYFPDRDARIWTPHFVPLGSRGPERNVFAFSALARLKPGVALEQAQAEGATVVKGLFEDARRARTPLDPVRAPDLRLIPLKEEMTREVLRASIRAPYRTSCQRVSIAPPSLLSRVACRTLRMRRAGPAKGSTSGRISTTRSRRCPAGHRPVRPCRRLGRFFATLEPGRKGAPS